MSRRTLSLAVLTLGLSFSASANGPSLLAPLTVASQMPQVCPVAAIGVASYSLQAAPANGQCPQAITQERARHRCDNFLRHLRDVSFSTGIDYTPRWGDVYATAGIDWDFSIQPTYQGRTIIRMDEWTVKGYAGANVNEFGMRAGGDAKIAMLRPYENPCDALDPRNTLWITQTPRSADALMRVMRQKDYFIYNGDLNIAINGGVSEGTPLTVRANVSYLISGGFQIHVRRLDAATVGGKQNVFNFKFVGDPKKIFGIEFSGGLDQNLAEGWLERRALKAGKLHKLFSWQPYQRTTSGALLHDYTVDMDDAQARAAIDQLFGSYFNVNSGTIRELAARAGQLALSLVDPTEDSYASAMRVVRSHFKNLGPLQALAAQGQPNGNGPLVSPVTLNSHIGTVTQTSMQWWNVARHNWEVNVGPVIGARMYNINMVNYLTDYATTAGEVDRHSIISEREEHFRIRGWIGTQVTSITDIESVFAATVNTAGDTVDNESYSNPSRWSVDKFRNMTISRLIRRSRISQGQVDTYLNSIRTLIPNGYPSLRARLIAEGWLVSTPSGDQLGGNLSDRGGQINLVYFFDRSGYELILRGAGRSNFRDLVRRAVNAYVPIAQLGRGNIDASAQNRLVRNLTDLFRADATNQQRFEAAQRLERSTTFVRHGTAIVMELGRQMGIPVDDLISLRLEITSTAVTNAFVFTYGNAQLDPEGVAAREALNEVLILDDRRTSPADLYQRAQ